MSLNVSGLSKTEIRLLARRLRRDMEIKSLSADICAMVETLPALINAGTVLTFHALPDEVNLIPLVEKFPDKHWYLPRIHSGNQITFHRYTAGDDLYPHAFGVLEPSPNTPVLDEKPDLIFVPGLVFDTQGHRLGYGKGFYDRILATISPGTLCIGVVPQALLASAPLPADEHDRPVSLVVTETSVIQGTLS